MSRNALSRLQFDGTTAKRATWEALEFAVPTDGTVVVRNESYGAQADNHVHAVNVQDGVPAACTCKADQFQSGACKHRIAVAINAPVLEAASADRRSTRPEPSSENRAIADGGQFLEPDPHGESVETCDHPDCEAGLGKDRPELCWDHWEARQEARR